MMAETTPLDLTQPWWEQHAGQGFLLPRCDRCQRFHFYPQPACPHCGHDNCQAAPASGRGEVYTFSIVHRAPSPAFAADVPYAVVVVKTDEGPHLMADGRGRHAQLRGGVAETAQAGGGFEGAQGGKRHDDWCAQGGSGRESSASLSRSYGVASESLRGGDRVDPTLTPSPSVAREQSEHRRDCHSTHTRPPYLASCSK
jgi:uncharacterized OB-fold protein